MATTGIRGPAPRRCEQPPSELGQLRERRRQLQEALDSRIVVEQAKGILAERLDLTLDEAYDLLRSAARSAGVRMHDLARSVVPRERTPVAIVVAAARTQRRRAEARRQRAEEHRRSARRELPELLPRYPRG